MLFSILSVRKKCYFYFFINIFLIVTDSPATGLISSSVVSMSFLPTALGDCLSCGADIQLAGQLGLVPTVSVTVFLSLTFHQDFWCVFFIPPPPPPILSVISHPNPTVGYLYVPWMQKVNSTAENPVTEESCLKPSIGAWAYSLTCFVYCWWFCLSNPAFSVHLTSFFNQSSSNQYKMMHEIKTMNQAFCWWLVFCPDVTFAAD